MAPLPWTDEQTERLKQWHAERLSTRVMGKRLGKTRNSVIGKLARLRLCVPRQSAPRKPKPKVERRGGFRPIVEPARPGAHAGLLIGIAQRLPIKGSVPFVNLPPDQSDCAVRLIDTNDIPESPNKCRYPLGEPTWDMEVCGARTVAGCSSCQRHFKIMRNQRAAA